MRYEDLPYIKQQDLRAILQALVDSNSKGKPLAQLILKEMDERPGLVQGGEEHDCAYFLIDLMEEWGVVFDLLRFRFFISDEVAKMVGIKVPKPAKRRDERT
jgi:hypothetical protein